MINSELSKHILEDLIVKLKKNKQGLSQDLHTLAADIATGIIQRYHLVTQQEFETQQKVLQAAEEKMRMLEKRLSEIEQTLTDKS